MPSKFKKQHLAKIKVLGIGGGGCNAISRMYDDFPRSIDLIAVNTDIQDLEHCSAKKKICIGKNLTKGLGTGMNPDLGRQAAEESRSEIAEVLRDADMVFLTAGLGGGTGTGAISIIAEIAREMGILTIAVVTKPFGFEGAQRNRIAEEGLIKIRDRVDTLITVPNDKIFSIIGKETTLIRAFEEIDRVLRESVGGISELILSPGIINVDFADIKAITRDAGAAMIGIGVASGNERAQKAANMAINSPLLDVSIDGAKGILFSISGQRDLKMFEVNEIAKMVSENADSSAKIIFGAYHDRKLAKGQVKVTLIAAGFSNILTKENRFLPPLFTSPSEFVSQATHLPFEADLENQNQLAGAGKTVLKNLDKKKKEDDEVKLEIPAFLRRKRR